MKVIFKTGFTCNTHEKSIKEMGEFMGANIGVYEDCGESEIYKFFKEKKVLQISVIGNKYEGGYMNSKVEEVKI